MLEQDLAFYGGDVASRYYRWRTYGTGAAMGLLLSTGDSSWQKEAAAGAALDDLLARAARLRPWDGLLPAARVAYGYDELLKTATRNVPVPGHDPIAAFFALTPHRITIEIDSTAGELPHIRFSPGRAGIARPAPQVTLLTNPQRVSITYVGFDASIQRQPVMVDGRQPGVLRYVVMLPSPARVSGDGAIEIRDADPRKVNEVTGERTKIVLQGSAIESITVTPNGMVIRVRAR